MIVNCWRAAACCWSAALLAACAGVPTNPSALAQQAQMRAAPERLIVLAVSNPSEPVATHAGSTLRGYDSLPRYAEGDAAHIALAALAAAYGLHEVAAWPIAPLKLHCVVFEIPEHSSRDAVLAGLAHDPRVRLAQPLQTFSTLGSSYNDPYVELQRGFAEVDAADAHQWSRGDGVRVAIIDTGVDVSHPDLQGRLSGQKNFVDDNAQTFRLDRHGTEVAGVIAAVANNRVGIVGIAPNVQLLVFKACWPLKPGEDAAQCNSYTLAQALVAAIESGAEIVNLSLGGPADPLLEQLVHYGLDKGQIFIGAVPPSGRTAGFPVDIEGVIAVDTEDRPASAAAVLRAPGREILTLTPGGHYDFASGSSLATAHVTGVVALLLSEHAGLDAASARQILRSTGDSIDACRALASEAVRVHCDRSASRLTVGGSNEHAPISIPR
ncbi:MAG: Serine protease [Hydrocarboniphaga sp.]|uniref:S8 family peptidase n=1 Tax=Hydrocarboniphaga sp. TaxID=2033016 RepID=UPI00260AAFF7|nr:S8 family serine peptidase [Hydrocarboniphaga sp.]MDB5973048.1 Serine protease [Hydrocarboniphaga sp.]